MSERRIEGWRMRFLGHVDRLGFALFLGISAGVGTGMRADSVVVGIAFGVAVFLIFGVELDAPVRQPSLPIASSDSSKSIRLYH
jgi:hypothetical protein